MARRLNPNLEILMFAVDQLGELADKMVFVGGCATGLLITDAAAPPIRVTRDVDAIVQVVSKADYYRLSEKLRVQGFKEDVSDDAPICRWVTDQVILDVMPTDIQILNFGNNMVCTRSCECGNCTVTLREANPHGVIAIFSYHEARSI
jgi:hypothetical protein